MTIHNIKEFRLNKEFSIVTLCFFFELPDFEELLDLEELFDLEELLLEELS